MKERPILFSEPMVRALLDGSKTQTRRVVTSQPESDEATSAIWVEIENRHQWAWTSGDDEEVLPNEPQFICPYGQPGDRLWVREAFAEGIHQMAGLNHWAYAADHFGTQQRLGDRWKPSIHMPRAASRITMEITGVRVERLQDIGEADCIAEGIERPEDMSTEAIEAMDVWPTGSERECFNALNQPVHQYRRLWEQINGPESWSANPWVWVIEFKRIEQATP